MTAAVLQFLAGFGVAALFWIAGVRMRRGRINAEADQIMQEAKIERERLLRAADVAAHEALRLVRDEHERQLTRQRDDIAVLERGVRSRETHIDRQVETLDGRERDMRKREQSLENAEARTRHALEEVQKRLHDANLEIEKIAGLSQQQARQRLTDAMQDDARREAAVQIRRIEQTAQEEADEAGKRVLAASIQRLAGDFVAEKSISVVELASDDMKGRIIGREGRNIRAIEAATGVDIIIDDTPEVVILSAFNPIRREIAKMALDRLVADGRIHPARIEEVVARAAEDMDQLTLRAGEQATFDLALPAVHPELVKLVGKLKYCVVNGQNMWNHAVETATLAGMMASEIGVNPTPVKRAGLLHDIGKVVDHQVEGHHAQIAADLARRHGEKLAVVQAIAQHHDKNPTTVAAVLLQIADTLSKTRPGARKEGLDTYIRRLQELERISLQFRGVEKAYAIQAGREVRVMVNYAQVSDDDAFMLSNEIARRIQDELTYPGDVRVTVIREARATEIAR